MKKMNASHRPNHDPSPDEIAAVCKEIRDEKAAIHAAKMQVPAKAYMVRGLDLKAARIGN